MYIYIYVYISRVPLGMPNNGNTLVYPRGQDGGHSQPRIDSQHGKLPIVELVWLYNDPKIDRKVIRCPLNH